MCVHAGTCLHSQTTALCSPVGFLRRVGQPKVLFKPVQGGSKGIREVAFYDKIWGMDSGLAPADMFSGLSLSMKHSEELVKVLRDILPCYDGIEKIADRSGHISILHCCSTSSSALLTCVIVLDHTHPQLTISSWRISLTGLTRLASWI